MKKSFKYENYFGLHLVKNSPLKNKQQSNENIKRRRRKNESYCLVKLEKTIEKNPHPINGKNLCNSDPKRSILFRTHK